MCCVTRIIGFAVFLLVLLSYPLKSIGFPDAGVENGDFSAGKSAWWEPPLCDVHWEVIPESGNYYAWVEDVNDEDCVDMRIATDPSTE